VAQSRALDPTTSVVGSASTSVSFVALVMAALGVYTIVTQLPALLR
jgi:hypothetical protein